jgi:hypothetical protein
MSSWNRSRIKNRYRISNIGVSIESKLLLAPNRSFCPFIRGGRRRFVHVVHVADSGYPVSPGKPTRFFRRNSGRRSFVPRCTAAREWYSSSPRGFWLSGIPRKADQAARRGCDSTARSVLQSLSNAGPKLKKKWNGASRINRTKRRVAMQS